MVTLWQMAIQLMEDCLAVDLLLTQHPVCTHAPWQEKIHMCPRMGAKTLEGNPGLCTC
jgi:hypothetical protein